MRCLLDTCTLIWLLSEPKKLSDTTARIIRDRHNEVFACTVSFWEISLKHAIGKLSFEDVELEELEEILTDKYHIGIIGLGEQESLSYFRLPGCEEHRDPFDRMLAWQAIKRDLALISSDTTFERYRSCGLRVIW